MSYQSTSAERVSLQPEDNPAGRYRVDRSGDVETRTGSKWPRFPWSLTALTVLVPIWCLGLFTRGPWMPDEPREYDIARNMLLDQDRLVPTLAGRPFLEKPPLTYWMDSWSMQLFGASAWAARLPNLLWATITIIAIGMLANELGSSRTRDALIAALITGTTVIVCQIQLWLATDAAVLAFTAVALLAIWKILDAPGATNRRWWYAVFWLAILGGFMAKSVLGVLVPVLTALVWITWEKRWSSVMRHWPLYAGAVAVSLLITIWFATLAHKLGPVQAAAALRDNTIGRFFGTSGHGIYELGHRTARFKFLGAIPYYVLPWTIASIGACRWCVRCLKSKECEYRSQIRFCLSASLPALLVLGSSATARDVYFGPPLLGLMLLTSLWLSGQSNVPDKFDQRVLKVTSMLMIALSILIVAATVLLWDPSARTSSLRSIAVQVVAALVMLVGLALLKREPRLQPIAPGLTCFVLALLVFATFAFPTIDRTENIAAALRTEPGPLRKRVALVCGDETTRAVLDFALNVRPPSVCDMDTVRSLLEHREDQKFLVQTDGGGMPPNVREALARLNINLHPKKPGVTFAGEFEKLGLRVEAMWCAPGGRRYALYGRERPTFIVGGDCR